MGDPSYEITRVNNGDREEGGKKRKESRPERIVVTKFRNNFRVRSCNRPLLHHSRFPEHRVRPSFADHRPVPLNARCIFYAIEGKKRRKRRGERIIKFLASERSPNFTGKLHAVYGTTTTTTGTRDERKKEKREKSFFCSGNRLKD